MLLNWVEVKAIKRTNFISSGIVVYVNKGHCHVNTIVLTITYPELPSNSYLQINIISKEQILIFVD